MFPFWAHFIYSLQIMLVKPIVNHINRINHSAANLWVISTVYNQKVCFTFIIDMYLPFFILLLLLLQSESYKCYNVLKSNLMHVIRKYFLFFAVCFLYVRMLHNCLKLSKSKQDRKCPFDTRFW